MHSPKKSGSRKAAGKRFKDLTRVSEKDKANVKGGTITLTNARLTIGTITPTDARGTGFV
jgi:hypothetical protein